MQVEATPAYWTNGPGYCEGDIHVRCMNGEVVSETVCPPGSCLEHGVPRTVFVGCATPHPLCTGPQSIDLYWVCDGKTPIACWGGFAVDADGSEINC